MLRGFLLKPFSCQPRAVVRVRRLQTIEKGTALLWLSVTAHTFFWKAVVLPIFPKRPRNPEFPRASKFDSQVVQLLATKTLVMMGVPRLLLLEIDILAPGLRSFADSVVQGLPGVTSFVHHQSVAIIQDMLSGTCHRWFPQTYVVTFEHPQAYPEYALDDSEE